MALAVAVQVELVQMVPLKTMVEMVEMVFHRLSQAHLLHAAAVAVVAVEQTVGAEHPELPQGAVEMGRLMVELVQTEAAIQAAVAAVAAMGA